MSLAGDPSDTISDFQFSPASITIHVGDTVSWTNNGPSPHTATADGGSFDTGTLQKGQSGSHTFTQAGTFTYFCRIHPFMHGTVVVAAAAGSGSTQTTPATGTQSSAGSGTATTPAAASTTPGLPATGLDLVSILIAGLLMLGAGLLIRRRFSAR
jgi:LPXTG-motif cell wall-anchored protein